ncbi:hypothetical protein AB205_0017660 [Aquarana catesbeiana]|uniref:Uncharacterized protein n=1 Tax=Aquarana catesbeiana TaxID=8400 RepID=A0A2G9RSA9_AQUCT|nr:hypothetical protein AB205_0017660 [Aquarana catesbeiana]
MSHQINLCMQHLDIDNLLVLKKCKLTPYLHHLNLLLFILVKLSRFILYINILYKNAILTMRPLQEWF